MQNIILTLSLVFFTFNLWAQEGAEIKLKLTSFEEESVYLGYYYGDKQYLVDTATIDKKGEFVFKKEEAYKGGIYLFVLPPDNRFIQVLLTEGEQHFSVKADGEKLSEGIEFKGSPDNTLFYDYMAYLADKRPQAEKLTKEIEAAKDDEKTKEKVQTELEALNKSVTDYQKATIEKHPNTLTAALIKANLPLDTPTFEELTDEKEKEVKRWRWTQKHYFDHINLGDNRMVRTPFLYQRIDHFINKMTVQHPDTINQALNQVLTLMQPSEELFKYYLVHFVNFYAKSKIVGMDAVYVHLVKNYYAKGLAPWTEEEQLKKMVDNANTLEPLLIGRVAPDIKMKKLDVAETLKMKDNENEHQRFKVGESLSLHEVKSPYTVLLFWASDCGHCKKSMPSLVEFNENFKDKGVTVFSVCTKTYKDVPACAELLDENKALNWINVVDPYFRSKFGSIYDVRSTPQIYILDDKKQIISKRIGTEQLPDVMQQIMEIDEKKKADQATENGK